MFFGVGWHERDGIYIFSTNITAERTIVHSSQDPLQLQLYVEHTSQFCIRIEAKQTNQKMYSIYVFNISMTRFSSCSIQLI